MVCKLLSNEQAGYGQTNVKMLGLFPGSPGGPITRCSAVSFVIQRQNGGVALLRCSAFPWPTVILACSLRIEPIKMFAVTLTQFHSSLVLKKLMSFHRPRLGGSEFFPEANSGSAYPSRFVFEYGPSVIYLVS